MREQQHTAESDAQNLTSQTQSMLNLNLKLQSTVNKGQIKTIDLELRKLEAAQASERLAIIRVRPSIVLLEQHLTFCSAVFAYPFHGV